MARNNHQEAIERTGETARAGVREATDRAEDVMKTGIQSAQRVADEFGRVFGFGGQNEDLTRQATQNLEAITETGTILMRGFQDVSREWLELTQERLRKNAQGMTKLAQCRTLPDLAAVNSVNASKKPLREHGLFVLVPCTCGQQTNVRPEDRFQRGHSTFGSVRDEKKNATEGAL